MRFVAYRRRRTRHQKTMLDFPRFVSWRLFTRTVMNFILCVTDL